MAFAIICACFAGFVGAVNTPSKFHLEGIPYSQLVATSPGQLSFLTARGGQPGAGESHSVSIENTNATEKPWLATAQAQFKDLVGKIDRLSAVAIGAASGAVIGAVSGGSGLWGQGPDISRCAAIGGFLGGVVGFMPELPYDEKEAREKKEAEAKAAEPEANITEFPEPTLEKLHQLALTAAALSDYEGGRAKLKGNETEKSIEHAQEKKAVRAIDDIVKRINSTEKEPMIDSEDDFEDIQEVLSEGDTSEFVSAEAAAENNALVTANDVARVQAGKNGSRLRAEDIGPAGDLDSFQGDMIPSSSKQLEFFQTFAGSSHGQPQDSVAAGASWTGARVKFCFASDVSERVKHIFLAATNQYKNAVPCLEFVDVGWAGGSSTSPDSQQRCKEWPAIFVQSNPAEGCYAYVGMVEWKASQRLQLQDPGCLNIGTAVHELGHALGMAHEQSRPDRDKHVKIRWNNIQHGREHNFQIEERSFTDAKYDLLSIMHYDHYAFARDPNKPSIEILDHGAHDGGLGQRVGLSASDVAQLVAMYRAESGTCKGNALAGMGCINKPDDFGKDPCNIDKCDSMAAVHCCACQGGVQVQCYENQACPKTDLLPDPQAHECIEDATHLFAGQGYPCIYSNVCKFNVEFVCPGLDCKHQVRPNTYEAAMCNAQFNSKICTARHECNVRRI